MRAGEQLGGTTAGGAYCAAQAVQKRRALAKAFVRLRVADYYIDARVTFRHRAFAISAHSRL